LNGLTNGVIPLGRTVIVDTSTPGYVLFDVLNGKLNPAEGQEVPMDLTSPLALGWLQVPGATAYDVYLGTVSNAVAAATTNTAGIYQGRTGSLTLNLSNLQPNTTDCWRVDGVAANGTPTKGTVYSFATGAPMVDFMEDTWVATDALNRSLPDLALRQPGHGPARRHVVLSLASKPRLRFRHQLGCERLDQCPPVYEPARSLGGQSHHADRACHLLVGAAGARLL
jgi:hypothetical protein